MAKTTSKTMKATFIGFLATAILSIASAAGTKLSYAAELTVGHAKLNSVDIEVLAARYHNGPTIILPNAHVCNLPYSQQIDQDTFLVTNSPCGSERNGLSLLLLRRSTDNVLTLSDIIKPDKLAILNVIPAVGSLTTVELIYAQGEGRSTMPARLAVGIRAGRFVFGRQPAPLANDKPLLPESIYRDLHRINFSPERIEALGCTLYSEQTKELAAKASFNVCSQNAPYIAAIRYLQSSAADRLKGVVTQQADRAEISTTFTIDD